MIAEKEEGLQMGKALRCAALEARVYLRSGRIILPSLAALAQALIFYAIAPVDFASGFTLSAVAALAIGAWIALSRAWAEEPRLSQMLSVKSGVARFAAAQEVCTAALCAACALFLAGAPLLWGALRPGLFTAAVGARAACAAIADNLCAGLCGGAFGGLFHPRLIPDRKLAYVLCALLLLTGFAGGLMGLPLPLRALLPPLYDLMKRAGEAESWPRGYASALSAWLALYALLASCARTALLARRRF